MLPAVFRVTVKEPTPLVSVIGAEITAAESVEVMVTTLLKLGETTLRLSLAETVKVNAVPATVLAGTEARTSFVAGAETAMVAEVTDLVPSVTVKVLFPEVFKVIEKVPTPLLRAVAVGRTAAVSVEVNETVPT
jgi:hypothetical protein